MITVVCLSPSLDQTITLPHFTMGGTNRAAGKRTVPGGKGVNVALTLAAMGETVRLAVFRHEHGAQPLFDALHAAGVDCAAVDVPGTLRTNIKLLDASCGQVTEVNTSAEPVPREAAQQMEEAVAQSAKASSWLVLTGSLPAGYAADAYARIIRRVRKVAPGCRIALDAEGEPLRCGVMEAPDFVKPNRHELELLAGRPLACEGDVLTAAREIASAGVADVLVSLDAQGSLLVQGSRAWRAKAIAVPVATTVGAGDALLSGYLHARGKSAPDALAYGVAAATARVAGRDAEAETYLPLAAAEPINS